MPNSSMLWREVINTPTISPFQSSRLMPEHPYPSRTYPEASRRESPHDTVCHGLPPGTQSTGEERIDLKDHENIQHRDLFSRGLLNVSRRESSGSLLRVSAWMPGILQTGWDRGAGRPVVVYEDSSLIPTCFLHASAPHSIASSAPGAQAVQGGVGWASSFPALWLLDTHLLMWLPHLCWIGYHFFSKMLLKFLGSACISFFISLFY